MKRAMALGVALAALAAAATASAQSRMGGHGMNIDADHDGWLTRAEASAAADRMFDAMDENHDGQLTRGEHRMHARHRRGVHAMADAEHMPPNCERTVERQGGDTPGAGERRITIICHGEDGEHSERRVTIMRGGEASGERRTRVERHIERAEREAEQAEREAERAAGNAERQVHREIMIIHDDEEDGETAMGPRHPMPPMPHMMLLMGSAEEADANNDGALSRDEFRTQHLRFFDASDANGDGKVRFAMPEPPTPPAPPEPPTPPPHR